ncbi:MAG: hypothetical protein KA524_11150 [Nitrosomonas sp.]|nr:hypothetical protein [Nitrosomonas sp.]MBP6076961.1 hypothetical protein [Nitrosomonas sp.]
MYAPRVEVEKFYRYPINVLLIIGMSFFCTTAQAATKDNFLIRNTGDIVQICSVSPEDRLYTQAIHFCHGFLVGIYRSQSEFYSNPGLSPLVCLPETLPSPANSGIDEVELSRNRIITEYIQWVKARPDYLQDSVVATVMKYLVDHFPCKDD